MGNHVLLIWTIFTLLKYYDSQETCINQNQLDSKLSFMASNFSNTPTIYLVYKRDKSEEIKKLNIQIESICIKDSKETNNYTIYLINNHITKKVVSYNEIKSKILEFENKIKNNSFIQTDINSYNKSTTVNINLTKQNRFIISIIVFFLSSIILFIIFRKTVDWATSAKAELNRYKDARYKSIADKIDNRFKYIRQIDI